VRLRKEWTALTRNGNAAEPEPGSSGPTPGRINAAPGTPLHSTASGPDDAGLQPAARVAPKPGGRPEAMMMVPMPYDRRLLRATSSWQASGFVGVQLVFQRHVAASNRPNAARLCDRGSATSSKPSAALIHPPSSMRRRSTAVGCCLAAGPRTARTRRGVGLSSRTGCRRQDVSGRHLIAGEALPDRLVLAGTAVDIGETALRL
jgi:hypothetical protein